MSEVAWRLTVFFLAMAGGALLTVDIVVQRVVPQLRRELLEALRRESECARQQRESLEALLEERDQRDQQGGDGKPVPA